MVGQARKGLDANDIGNARAEQFYHFTGQDYATMGSLGVETLYKLIKGEEVDLGDDTNFIDTGYEVVDINNYEEVWKTKTPW